MGLFQAILGNANQTSVEDVQKEWGRLLSKDEVMQAAYKLIRDYIIFTNKRLILIDVQGITGKKIKVQTIPYGKIVSFAVETAGVMDLNAELVIHVASQAEGLRYTFNSNVNIYEVQAILSDAIFASNA